MRIYDINPADSTLIDPAGREAPLDPMRREPRIPSGATSDEPPATGENKIARWTGEAWEVIPDFRGHVYWTADGEKHEITDLGIEPASENVADEPRPTEYHNLVNGVWEEDAEAALAAWRKSASISSRQGEQQLILAGLDEQVEAAISGIADETQRKLTRAWYQRAATWERNNPELKALGAALELTDEQIDDLFRQASEL